jgi:hypothetical protein
MVLTQFFHFFSFLQRWTFRTWCLQYSLLIYYRVMFNGLLNHLLKLSYLLIYRKPFFLFKKD